MGAWLGQAKLACGATPVIEAFKLNGLDQAANEFTDRLRYFATD